MANEYWEYKLPAGFRKPSESATNEELGKFINDKYVKRLYVPKNAIDPVHEYLERKDELGSIPIKSVLKPPVAAPMKLPSQPAMVCPIQPSRRFHARLHV